MNILLSYSGKNIFRHRTAISQLLRRRNRGRRGKCILVIIQSTKTKGFYYPIVFSVVSLIYSWKLMWQNICRMLRNKYTSISAANRISAFDAHNIRYPIQAPHFWLCRSSESLCSTKHCQHPVFPVRSSHNMILPNTVVALPNSTVWQVITIFICHYIYLTHRKIMS
jgi:hypothetical protein